jgi:hypothetical protein
MKKPAVRRSGGSRAAGQGESAPSVLTVFVSKSSALLAFAVGDQEIVRYREDTGDAIGSDAGNVLIALIGDNAF